MIFRTDTKLEFHTHERCHIIEILNQIDNPNLSIAQARVEPGITTQLHAVSVDEYYYILKGKGRVEVDGRHGGVTIGDVVQIHAGQSQRITNTGNTDLLFICICTPRFKPDCYSRLEG